MSHSVGAADNRTFDFQLVECEGEFGGICVCVSRYLHYGCMSVCAYVRACVRACVHTCV